MAVVKELLRVENDGSLSFGDYTLPEKTKKEDFEYEGDIYKVKTFEEITKLEKNGMFLYESVPGTSVDHLRVSDDTVAFGVSGKGSAQFTLELEPDEEYTVFIDDVRTGRMATNMSGKLVLSAELREDREVSVKVVRE